MALRRIGRADLPGYRTLSSPRTLAASPRLKRSSPGAEAPSGRGSAISQARTWGSEQDGGRLPASSSVRSLEEMKREMMFVEAAAAKRRRERERLQKDLRSKKRQRIMQTSVQEYWPRASRGQQSLLELSHPKAGTRHDYEKLRSSFWEFVVRHRLDAKSLDGLDRALADYLDRQYLAGEQGDAACNLWAALRHARPELGRASEKQLQRFMKAVRTWSRAAPAQSRDPSPAVVRSGVEAALIYKGYPDEAVFVALAFECYLRFGECFNLAPRDVIAPTQGLAPTQRFWSVRLCPIDSEAPSKTGVYDDTIQVDQPDASFLGKVLQRMKKQRLGQQRLFSFSATQMRTRWAWALHALNIQGRDFCLHSLRHGGASRDAAERRRSLLEVQLRGRWRTTGTLARYEKHGRLQRTLDELDEDTVKFCEKAHQHREQMHITGIAPQPPYG